jgi:AcrR family transcriptional regulator
MSDKPARRSKSRTATKKADTPRTPAKRRTATGGGATRSTPHPPESARSREATKARTRRKLLDAALKLLAGERSFSSISLREIAREAGVVPTAFYRHFDGMESLGLALVDESFAELRTSMREARKSGTQHDAVRRSVHTFLYYVRDHPLHYRFIAKERFSGSTALRFAIRQETRVFTSEMAADVARLPAMKRVSTEDVMMIADLGVQAVIAATERVLDLAPGDDAEFARIRDTCEKQILLLLIGASTWRSDRWKAPPEPEEDDE